MYSRINLTPFYPSGYQLLTKGYPVYGYCGRMTRIYILVFDRLGIDSRKLQIGKSGQQDTVIEIEVDGRYIVADPSVNLIFRDKDGRAFGRRELAEGTNTDASYPYLFTFQQYIRYEKLGLVGDIVSGTIAMIDYDSDVILLPHLYGRVYLLWLVVVTGTTVYAVAGTYVEVLAWMRWNKPAGVA